MRLRCFFCGKVILRCGDPRALRGRSAGGYDFLDCKYDVRMLRFNITIKRQARGSDIEGTGQLLVKLFFGVVVNSGILASTSVKLAPALL